MAYGKYHVNMLCKSVANPVEGKSCPCDKLSATHS
jgi:hypothetical protein